MKCFMIMALAVGALAQSSSTTEETTTVTEFFSDCSTLPVTGYQNFTATHTGTVTETYCHECDKTKGIFTTYTTVYQELCPTGTAPVTYTITEKCKETEAPRPSDHVPEGFTVTTVACAPCEAPSVVLTTPCDTPTAPPVPIITQVAVNTSTICHTCNTTITSVPVGGASGSVVGFGFAGLFTFIAGALMLL